MKYDNSGSLMIREMLTDERPREKLVAKGPEYLTDVELLAILLRTGTQGMSAIDVSRNLLKNYNQGVRSLTEVKIEELCAYEGIGKSKAALILAAVELGKRIATAVPENRTITSPEDVYRFYGEEMKHLKKEEFRTIMLDTKNRIISESKVSVGTLSSSLVHPREVFKDAIRISACSMILVHNHPSGNSKPSRQDFMTTSRLKECGDIVGISIVDHIVIGDGEYYSFKENNDL